MQLQYQSKELSFLKPAKTSRGEYTQKKSILLKISDAGFVGLGEVAPLPDLSTDGKVDFESVLENLVGEDLNDLRMKEFFEQWAPGSINALPSLRFALHAAWNNLNYLKKRGKQQNEHSVHWVDTPFTLGQVGMKINGLVWMNDIDAMYAEALSKIEAGFNCIKIKVGALDFDDECRLLEKIRKSHSAFSLELRLDANGAFLDEFALEQIKELSRFGIHSIEQPVKKGSGELDKVCRESQIDIALDESLIGLHPIQNGVLGNSGRLLLQWAKPKYIILKPTLLGGTDMADLWIEEAQKLSIGWWSTSALEGNVGLASIAQWVSQYEPEMPQGLGTGALYKDNFSAFTSVVGDRIWYKKIAP